MTSNVIHSMGSGPDDAPPMVFLPPNGMDGRAWLFQVARFSPEFRTISLDLPGCSRAPRWQGSLGPAAIAEACWKAVDEQHNSAAPAVLVGCSVGARIAQEMFHQRPSGVSALVLTGTGFTTTRDFSAQIDAWETHGPDQRPRHIRAGFSPSFRESPIARWFSDSQIDGASDTNVGAIVSMMKGAAGSTWEPQEIVAPVLIQTGSEDPMHEAAFELHRRLSTSEVVVLAGAGHVAQVEMPDEFDAHMLAFLDANQLRP